MKSNHPFKFVALQSAVIFLLLAETAFAQATRTWVSGVGDDANPCSRTAPCKTFAGAISKTAVGGEINVIDPGGYGAVTITKAMTIDGEGALASVLSAGTTGININAGTNDVITLRNLSINGAGSGIYGIRVLSAGVVRIENCVIFGTTTNGIDFQPSNGNALLYIQNSHIYQCKGAGVFVKPATTATATIEGSVIEQCAQGINAGSGVVTVSDVTVSANTGAGLTTSGGGSIRTYRNNRVFGNNPDGSFTGSLPLR